MLVASDAGTVALKVVACSPVSVTQARSVRSNPSASLSKVKEQKSAIEGTTTENSDCTVVQKSKEPNNSRVASASRLERRLASSAAARAAHSLAAERAQSSRIDRQTLLLCCAESPELPET